MRLLHVVIVMSCMALLISCGGRGREQLKSEAFLNEEGRDAVLDIVPKVIDFGKVKASAQNVLHLSAAITNTGTRPLVLYKADVSCGCMDISLDKRPLPVGESMKIVINVKTEGNKGTFDKAVFIQSNAKNNPEIIRIKGVFIE